MITWIVLWYILAVVCAVLAAVGVGNRWFNLLAAAVLFLILALGTPSFSAVFH